MLNPVRSPLLDIPGIAHGFFTRQGGVSQGVFDSLNVSYTKGDDASHVAENRRRIAAHYGLDVHHLSLSSQVHGKEVLEVVNPLPAHRAPKADALVTHMRGVLLGVTSADCCPILLADPEAGLVGAIHAGWRGALEGIIEETLKTFERLGCRRPLALIGPCIQQESYAVTGEFHKAFLDQSAENAQFFKAGKDEYHYLFDLPGFCASRLRDKVAAYDCIRRDTCAESEMFFSNRRASLAGESTFGLQLSTIVLTS